jgi:membrane-associated protein
MDSFLGNLSTQYPLLAQYKYLILFLVASLEGFSALLFAGFLVSVNALALLPTFLVLLAGELTNGFLWYSVGYFGGAKPIDWLTRKNEKKKQIVHKVRTYFERYTGRAIILAKMTFSLTVITQILVGSLKYSFKKFSWYNFIGSFGWVVLVLTVGYFFGEGYKVFFQYWKNISHLITYIVIAIVLIYILRIAFRSIILHYLDLVEKVQRLSERIILGIDKMMADEEDLDK